ncbi:MAG: glycoside hydrolase family 43 protein [Oscillospiraceae bacterium]|jgi:beta-xylosidase|nr:glycoside hydrolase family 43 protein [Oscillospiraceae bacterium]
MEKISGFKTPLVSHIYTADPSAHVFEGKLYIYPSHDLENEGLDDGKGDHFKMQDYHVLSMDDIGAPCVDHGEALHIKDVPWASEQMWAPDAAYKDGTYFFYFPAKDKDGIFRVGVATSKIPAGPFKAEPNYIPGSYSIDPAVFVDDDGRAYMYNGGLWGGQLERWKTGSYNPNEPHSEAPFTDEDALGPWVAEMSDDMLTFKTEPEEFKILDENGAPLKASDEERRFFEAPWLHKFNGKYYLSYSTGNTHFICYAESETPLGPFTYKGRVLEPVLGWTNHHSIVEFKGKWYLFYHDSSLSGGKTHLRNAMYTELEIAPDGTITTIKPYGD